jgi:hypothetical protein
MRATHEDYGPIYRQSKRSEPPAVCYTCGAEVPETPRFGNEATCDDCARREPVEPWLSLTETRES